MTDYSNSIEKSLVIIDYCVSSIDNTIDVKTASKLLDCTYRTVRRIFHIMDNISYEVFNFDISLKIVRGTESSMSICIKYKGK